MIVAFNYKFAKSNLLPNSSKINFNHANVFCSLFALNHRLLCNHVHCILRAPGERHARTVIDSIFFTIDLADPGFSPTIPCPFANYELAYCERIPGGEEAERGAALCQGGGGECVSEPGQRRSRPQESGLAGGQDGAPPQSL